MDRLTWLLSLPFIYAPAYKLSLRDAALDVLHDAEFAAWCCIMGTDDIEARIEIERTFRKAEAHI